MRAEMRTTVTKKQTKLGEKLASKIGQDRLNQFRQMFLWTWQYIGFDWLAMCPRQRCKGSDVQEAVADADRFMDYRDKQVVAAWRALDRSTQDEVLDYVFPRSEWHCM